MNIFLYKLKKLLRDIKYLKRVYSFVALIKKKLNFHLDSFRFRKYRGVYKDNKLIFQMLDMGEITRMRSDLFETKEPETLKWIDSFLPEDKFLDIGANVGVFSIYAALNKIDVIAIEPDALNYALLNINIRKNNLNKFILPYSIAFNDSEKFSFFNISSIEWGGALNAFDNELDFKGNRFKPIHRQGVYGLPLDKFIDSIGVKPNHIKIDVDGNEFLILKGAKDILKSENLKSLLVELDESRNDYEDSLKLIKSCGLVLEEKTHAKMFDNAKFATTYNHIFFRKKN